MTEITGGELLARTLANEGVRFVFGLPCPEIDPLLVALEAHGMRFVPVRHESAGVHMAEGLYKTTGQVAVVLGNPGPGSTNLLPGVVTARHEGVPVLVITSQHRMGVVYPATPATFQGQDQVELFKPTVKWGGPVFDWTRIPELVRMGFREMWAGRPGPVHLDIPISVMYTTGDPARAPIFAPTAGRPAAPQPSEGQLATAADLLASARSPVIFAGSGVERAGACRALLELAELVGCPVMPSFAGRGVMPHDHPLYFSSQSPAADALRQQADVVLVVGSRLGTLDVPYDKYWGDPTRCQLIQVDVDPRHIGVARPVALGIVADAKATLEGLVAKLRGRGLASRGRSDVAARRAEFVAWKEELGTAVAAWDGPGIHPVHVLNAVGEAFGRDAIYCSDGGYTALWSTMVLPSARPSSYHGITEFGMLGVGIPAAIGSKLGDPSREVVCVTGDGAAGFNFMEMQVAARENIKITVVLMADGAWTMEMPNGLMRWGKTFGTAMGEVRWDKVAEGLGCHAEFVESMADVGPALARARAHEGPALVCVRTSVAANMSVPASIGERFLEVFLGPTPWSTPGWVTAESDAGA